MQNRQLGLITLQSNINFVTSHNIRMFLNHKSEQHSEQILTTPLSMSSGVSVQKAVLSDTHTTFHIAVLLWNVGDSA